MRECRERYLNVCSRRYLFNPFDGRGGRWEENCCWFVCKSSRFLPLSRLVDNIMVSHVCTVRGLFWRAQLVPAYAEILN